MNANQAPEPPPEATKSVTIRLPESLENKVISASNETGLARADVYRLSIDRGVDKLLDQLRGEPAKVA